MNDECGSANFADGLERHSRPHGSVSVEFEKLGAASITLHAAETRIVLLDRF